MGIQTAMLCTLRLACCWACDRTEMEVDMRFVSTSDTGSSAQESWCLQIAACFVYTAVVENP